MHSHVNAKTSQHRVMAAPVTTEALPSDRQTRLIDRLKSGLQRGSRAASAGVATFACLAALFIAPHAQALSGGIDKTFNGTGVVITDVFGGADEFVDLAVQVDKKIVAVGTCTITGQANATLNRPSFCAVRYNENGTLDTSFASGGKWFGADSSSPTLSYDSLASAVAITPSGSIIIAGTCRTSFMCYVQLSTTGTPEISFQRSGAIASQPGLLIQPDGKIVLAGISYSSPLGVNLIRMVRFSAAGVQETTTFNGGVAAAQMPLLSGVPGQFKVKQLLINADNGKLVVVSSGFCCASNDGVSVAQFNSNGTLDTAFQNSGQRMINGSNVGGNGRSFSALTAKITNVSTAGEVIVEATAAVLAFNSASNIFNNFPRSRGLPSGCTGWAAAYTRGDDSVTIGGEQLATNPSEAFSMCRAKVNANLAFSLNATVDATFPAASTAFDLTTNAVSRMDNHRVVYTPDAKLVAGVVCAVTGVDYKFCLQRYDTLGDNCYDIDGDGTNNPLIDGLITVRAQLGFRDAAVTNGITLPASATRTTWPALRDYMAFKCGMRGIL